MISQGYPVSAPIPVINRLELEEHLNRAEHPLRSEAEEFTNEGLRVDEWAKCLLSDRSAVLDEQRKPLKDELEIKRRDKL